MNYGAPHGKPLSKIQKVGIESIPISGGFLPTELFFG